MNFFTDFLKTIGFFALGDAINLVIQFLKPPRWDSWQTLLCISGFSWIFSLLAQSAAIEGFIASFAWIFLISGLHWAMHDKRAEKELKFNGFFIGPWITGALICLFLWSLFNDLLDLDATVFFDLWAPISALLAVAPRFIVSSMDGPKLKIPDLPARQAIIILLLWNFLISCWFQFYFSTQTLLRAYPTLLADDLSRSAFVYKLPSEAATPQRGVLILQQTESVVRSELAGRPWSQVERWLLNLKQQLPSVERTVKTRISEVEENAMWSIDGRVIPGSDYQLELRSVWKGPTADGMPYYLAKVCQVSPQRGPVAPGNNPAAIAINRATPPEQPAQIDCGPATGPIKMQP